MGEAFLGMPGLWAKDYREVADHYTSKVGGLPDWPEVDIGEEFCECGACGSRLCLIAQIYAPLHSDSMTIEDRTIYIFGCTVHSCGNNPLSWRALRVQKNKSEETSSPNEEATSLGTSSAPVSNNRWLDDICTDDFGELDSDEENDYVDLEELSRALSEAASLASNSKKQSVHQKSQTVKKLSPIKLIARTTDANIPVLPCFYIYSQRESSSGRDISAVCSNYSLLSITDKECDLKDPKEEETWAEEGYEYDKALFVDRAFMKFKKRMDAYPDQCFRYMYGGKPLLASGEIEVHTNCKYCGGLQQYEMQLMPPLLHFLREANDGSSTHSTEHWNWMTLIVYTCSMACLRHDGSNKGWSVSEETVIMQFE